MSADAKSKATTIAVDAMGADLGPEEVVAAAALALKNNWATDKLILVGQESILEPLLVEHASEFSDRIDVFNASEVIEMHEKPIQSLRSKKDASLVRAVELVKHGTCGAAVSCGNTGSLMACSTLKLRPIQGVSKPALASVWPRRNGKFVVLDVGANPQCKAENLAHYAILGHRYAIDALGSEKPRVGLLSIGTEEGKGTELTTQAHTLLKTLGNQIEYAGLIEGFDLFESDIDVVVTDGFTGNVLLKSCESLWKMLKGGHFRRGAQVTPAHGRCPSHERGLSAMSKPGSIPSSTAEPPCSDYAVRSSRPMVPATVKPSPTPFALPKLPSNTISPPTPLRPLHRPTTPSSRRWIPPSLPEAGNAPALTA
jgi:glycerol-3-phosphate acyltransferase PlsX